MEWPTPCKYWKDPQVVEFLAAYGLDKSQLHGCAYGLTNKKGQFMKKPWTVATTSPIVAKGIVRKCDGSHTHVMARGRDCKNAEGYTVEFAKHVHMLLRSACASYPSTVGALSAPACPAPLVTGQITDAIQGSTPSCGRFPTPPSPFSFSSALSISHSLAQATPRPIRDGQRLLPCCATTAARGELDMSQFLVPSPEPQKDNLDTVKRRRVVASRRKTRLVGQADVSWRAAAL